MGRWREALAVLALAVTAGCARTQERSAQAPSPEVRPAVPDESTPTPPAESIPAAPRTSADGHVWYYYPALELYQDETEGRFYWRQSIGWFSSRVAPRDRNPVGDDRVNVYVGGKLEESGPSDEDLERHRIEFPRTGP